MRKITFNECPRPQFVRGHFEILDGHWDFAFDKENLGEAKTYYNGFAKEYDILVPFVYQTSTSGINIQTRCDYVWYQRKLNITKVEDKRVILHFEGSDKDFSELLTGDCIDLHNGGYPDLSLEDECAFASVNSESCKLCYSYDVCDVLCGRCFLVSYCQYEIIVE